MRTPACFASLHGSLRLTLVLGALVLSGSVDTSPALAQVAAPPAIGQPAGQPVKKREVSDRQICKAITFLLNKEHLTRHALDDEISQRAIKLFVKSLDPMKLYFYQSDIEEFNARRNDLDDLTKTGDMSFAYAVYNRLLQRIDERVKMVEDILSKPIDFKVDDVLVTDADKLNHPVNEAEAYDRWKKRIKYDLLVLRSDKEDKGEADHVARLRRRYNSFAKRMKQTDGDELLEMFLTSVTTSYDPHTTFMSPSTLDNFDIAMKLGLDGIGVALQLTDGYTIVSKVIPGGAADKEGSLKEGDRLVAIGQGPSGELVDSVDMKLNDIVGLVRGKAGTLVRLGIIPKGQAETKVVSIVRAAIKLNDSEARAQIIEDGKKPNGMPYRVGVIDLPSFYMDMDGARKGMLDFKSTTRDVRVILDDFNKKNVDAVVLDLRRNGGGSLTEAINLTGLFIEEGPVVQVKDPAGQVQHYDDLDRAMLWRGPLVVLTSKFSASASEIFAGAIQDYRRGLVVGDSSTHGKGTVQSLLELGKQLFGNSSTLNLGALKITMQQFYRPNGDSTQKRGVLADVVLPSLTDHIEGISESDLDYSVPFDKVPANAYGRYNQVSNEVVTQLKTRSTERVRASNDFTKLNRTIERYLEQKAKKEVSLNEEKFMAQRKEIDAEREEEKRFEEASNGNKSGEIVKRDYYFNEVLAVTIDYLQLLGQNTVARLN